MGLYEIVRRRAVRKLIAAAGMAVLLASCGQQVVYVQPTDRMLISRLVKEGIDPCRVYPCRYAGKTEVEIVNVPAEDRGDFLIFPHKEAVVLKPIDAVPPLEKVEEGKCR